MNIPTDHYEKKKFFVEMSEDEYDKLMCTEFPNIFRERNLSMQETCMCWGFGIGAGWRELLYDVCVNLRTIENELGLITVATQIKEKFAGLRFYFSLDYQGDDKTFKVKDWYPIIDSLTSNAENQSYYTCEYCGNMGKRRSGGWVKTLCDSCEEHKDVARNGVKLDERGKPIF